MTRHAAYKVTRAGRRLRYPFASFPHADAARRWVESHPDAAVAFVPPLPAEDDDDTLGACGCRDYHAADCPTRTGGSGMDADAYYARLSRPGYDPYYDGYDA